MKESDSLDEIYSEWIKCIQKKQNRRASRSFKAMNQCVIKGQKCRNVNVINGNTLFIVPTINCNSRSFPCQPIWGFGAAHKNGKSATKSGETGEPKHKQGLEIHHMHTTNSFSTILLTQMFCAMTVKKTKKHFHKNSSCSTDRRTAGDPCVCRLEKWMIS